MFQSITAVAATCMFSRAGELALLICFYRLDAGNDFVDILMVFTGHM